MMRLLAPPLSSQSRPPPPIPAVQVTELAPLRSLLECLTAPPPIPAVQVTELAPLRSLLECLKEPNLRASFPVLTLCGFAIQICDGMQYLESKRLIHR